MRWRVASVRWRVASVRWRVASGECEWREWQVARVASGVSVGVARVRGTYENAKNKAG